MNRTLHREWEYQTLTWCEADGPLDRTLNAFAIDRWRLHTFAPFGTSGTFWIVMERRT